MTRKLIEELPSGLLDALLVAVFIIFLLMAVFLVLYIIGGGGVA